MSNTRIDDILKSKKVGDVWYSLEAPEEVRFWSKDRPWKEEVFSKASVKLEGLLITASKGTGKENKETFDKKNPMYLDCGIDIVKGFINTTQSMSASFRLRVDSCKEANIALKELSDKTGFDQWEIRAMDIYNPPVGIMTEFKVHNPNCQGNALSTWRFQNGDGSKLYPDASLSFQQKAVGGFTKEYTHCTQNEETILKPNCAKKLHRKGTQVKVKKAQKDVHGLHGHKD